MLAYSSVVSTAASGRAAIQHRRCVAPRCSNLCAGKVGDVPKSAFAPVALLAVGVVGDVLTRRLGKSQRLCRSGRGSAMSRSIGSLCRGLVTHGAGGRQRLRTCACEARPRQQQGRKSPQESEEERLRLDKEAREGMEDYMQKIEILAEKGNIRAQKTAWKWKVRKKVWNYLEDNDIADFPRPVHHRIPNFKGAAEAGKRMAGLPEFYAAEVVKVNPDTPQKSVRVAVLQANKTLYAPQPRLRTGFFSRIVPNTVLPSKFNFAATAGGMKQMSEPLGLDDRTKIDIVVVGSSAVNPENGARVGKGEGFAELEYGMMRQLGMIDENTPVITTVHDSQVISEDMPPEGKVMMVHDVPVDIIVTPTRVIRVPSKTRLPKPTGIYWDILSQEKFDAIRVLQTLKKQLERETGTQIKLAEQEEALPPLAKRGQRPGQRPPAKTESPAEPPAPEPEPEPRKAGVKSKLARPKTG